MAPFPTRVRAGAVDGGIMRYSTVYHPGKIGRSDNCAARSPPPAARLDPPAGGILDLLAQLVLIDRARIELLAIESAGAEESH